MVHLRNLSSEVIDSFFNKHIPYRLEMLNTIKSDFWNDTNVSKNQDYFSLRICAVEASRIAQRQFIQFLGLGVRNDMLIVFSKKKTKDIDVADLGGLRVNPDLLTDLEKEILIKSYITGNMSTAHITFDETKNTGYPEVLVSGADLIYKLLNKNLFEIVGREILRYR